MKPAEIKQYAMDRISDDQLERRLKYAYLELGDVNRIKVDNPLLKPAFRDRDKLLENIAEWMRDPDNLWFVCKYVLNVDLLPFQVVILKQLWTKPFPMVIATRGGSKSFMLTVYLTLRALLDQGAKIVVVGAALRQSLVLYNYLQAIWQNAPVLQDICGGTKFAPKRDLHMCSWKCGKSEVKFLPLGNGETIRGQRACVDGETLIETSHGLIKIADSADLMSKEDFLVYTESGKAVQPHTFVKTKPIPAYKITTNGQYEIICSDIHKLLTADGWKDIKDITTNDAIKFEYSTDFPSTYIEVDGHKIDEDIGFLMGLLISEGSISSKHTISVKMTDKECVDLLSAKMQEIDGTFNVCRYEYPARFDSRWKSMCKPTYEAKLCNLEFRNLLEKMGLHRRTARDKEIPWSILRSPKSVVTAFLRGLFWGDGSAFLYKSKERLNNFGIAYYSGSKRLCDQLQSLITKYDIFVTKFNRPSKLSRQTQFGLRIYGVNGIRFADTLGLEKWKEITRQAYRPTSIRRREYLSVTDIEILPPRSLYDYYIPDGNKFIGNCLVNHNTVVIADEFASIPPDVFETVVRGFAAVKSVGLVESVSEKFRHKEMAAMGIEFVGKDQESMTQGTATKTNLGCNQIVIAGTTTYQFNHFYKYYSYYRAIIESCGDAKFLREHYPDMVIPPNIDSTQYCIMRIPYDLVPPGMMDEAILAQGRATMNSVIFDQEYGCIFPSDSDGFYPATDIHRATCPVRTSEGTLDFGAEMYGDQASWYAMGIDPASEQDHFAICIIKMVGNMRHMVYQWSTNRKRYLEMKEKGLVDSSISDYTSFCIKHIRSLVRRFPIKLICCDAGGGGLSIKEGLLDKDKMEPGDFAIYDMDDENMLGNQGSYILKMIRFQETDWRKEAHYGLKKDISDKKLLFPKFDTVQIAINPLTENSKNYETLDECYTEIEECKYETILIKHDMSNTGTERWDVPKLKISGADDIKKSLKKDRFTSLLLANWACRLIAAEESNATNYVVIGRSMNKQVRPSSTDAVRYIGPNAKKLRQVSPTSGLYRGMNNRV